MNNETVTTTVEKTTTEIKKEKTIDASLFLLFAEFLGYTSPIVDWAEKVCKGEKVPEYQKNIIKIDAQGVFNQMLKENLTKEDLRGWFDELYDLLLKKYVSNNDLPF